ncbi:acetolactate synthase-like protein isoform X1 [Varroa jacobsoni]|uniref:acetolactate synthase-like protein isoform X1 n=1 Tax=Varroa jacobsoni TaxID=62625 RepID=UPI000BF456BB|nr:acetolactate synthase-like protein isoform X1 [Varroa jacobsoni]
MAVHGVCAFVVNNWLTLTVMAAISGALASLSRRLSALRYLIARVDKSSQINGGDLVAKVLKHHGITQLFCLSGGHISPILVGAEKLGIRIVDTRHEVNAVFAADAVARLTGNVGVAAVTAGPGVTNTITAVKNAQMAESPLLLLGGAAATVAKGRGALQDIDQLSLLKSICKFSASTATVRDIVPTLRLAIQTAMSDTPGPVFVELPLDVLYPYNLVKQEVGMKNEPKNFGQQIVKWYLDFYLHNLFAGGFDATAFGPLPMSTPLASASQVQKCAEVLSKAKKPVFILGSQATLGPKKAENLKDVLEGFGVPCFLGGMSRGCLGKDSPYQMRHCRKDALKEADVVFLLGSVCDFRLSYGRVLSSKSKIVAVNRNKEQLFKNSDAFWKPTEAVQADVGSFLADLRRFLPGYKCDYSWVKSLRAKDSAKESKNKEMASQPVDKYLNPIKLLSILEEMMPDNTIIIADGGDFVATAAYILKPRGPLKWLDPGPFGTLGVGGGFAIGAKLAQPDANVIIIYGDGSAGYSLMEFDSFTRQKIPVTAIVGNDACWTQILREQIIICGSSVACPLSYCDYDVVAKGLGAEGRHLTGGDEERIADIFKEAIELNKQGKSVLINALIGKTAFRDGSISV